MAQGKVPFPITAQPLVESPDKFLCMIRDLVTKKYRKFIALRSFFEIFKKKFKNAKISYLKSNKFIENKKRLIQPNIYDLIFC